MQTIKVFIASSEELKDERVYLSHLFSKIDREIRPLGFRVEPEKWEYLDASMGPKHKQEEYNDTLRECDLCLALFWTRFGEYTEEELNVAYNGVITGGNPHKLYVYCKATADANTPELQAFKDILAEKYGQPYNTFDTRDSLGVQFREQIMEYIQNL